MLRRIDRLVASSSRVDPADLNQSLTAGRREFLNDLGHGDDDGCHCCAEASKSIALPEPDVMQAGGSDQAALVGVAQLVRVLRDQNVVAGGCSVGQEEAILLALPAAAVDVVDLVSSQYPRQQVQGLNRHVLVEQYLHATPRAPDLYRSTSSAKSVASLAPAAETEG